MNYRFFGIITDEEKFTGKKSQRSDEKVLVKLDACELIDINQYGQ